MTLFSATAAQAITGSDEVVDVTLVAADQGAVSLGSPVAFTVTVASGSEPTPAGQVSIWDATAQRYLAFDCPITSPGAYTCTGRFDAPGLHELTASYHLWWPRTLSGASAPLTHTVDGAAGAGA